MVWIAAVITGWKRVIAAPPLWAAVWIVGTVAGLLTGWEGLALGSFLIGAPALLLTLYLEMRRCCDASRQRQESLVPDYATRVRLEQKRHLGAVFARDLDPNGHTLH